MADASNSPSDADIQAALKAAQEAVAAVNAGMSSAPAAPVPAPVEPVAAAAGNQVDPNNPLAGLDIAALQAEADGPADSGGGSGGRGNSGGSGGMAGGRAIGGEHIPSPFDPPMFVPGGPGEKPVGIDLLGDVHLNVKIELGRTRMLVEDVLRLGDGSVVELDKLAGDPVDIYVNDRPVARGEVLVLNDNFCVRINEIVTQNPQARAAG